MGCWLRLWEAPGLSGEAVHVKLRLFALLAMAISGLPAGAVECSRPRGGSGQAAVIEQCLERFRDSMQLLAPGAFQGARCCTGSHWLEHGIKAVPVWHARVQARRAERRQGELILRKPEEDQNYGSYSSRESSTQSLARSSTNHKYQFDTTPCRGLCPCQ